ncbi:MAG: helix-turn-helix domain-containing protein [Sporichthyaceae bacterium]|nr:helix-turn-helix domain-containing protein [Sporichthyaceae bacterium]
MPLGRFDWERLLRRVRMPQETKGLALLLATYGDDKGESIHPGEPRLAVDWGRDERTIRRHIEALRDTYGLIHRVRRGGGPNRRADEYRLVYTPELIEGRWIEDPELRTSVSGESEADTPPVLRSHVSGEQPAEGAQLRSPVSGELAAAETELRSPVSGVSAVEPSVANTVLRTAGAGTPDNRRHELRTQLCPPTMQLPTTYHPRSPLPPLSSYLDQSCSPPAGDTHPREKSITSGPLPDRLTRAAA